MEIKKKGVIIFSIVVVVLMGGILLYFNQKSITTEDLLFSKLEGIILQANTGQTPPIVSFSIDNDCDTLDNVFFNDGADTFCDKNKRVNYFYSPNVPAGATVDGIEVEFINAYQDDAGKDSSSQVRLSWDNGTSWTEFKFMNLTSDTDANYVNGSSTDTWGHTWTIDQINNNLRVWWANEENSGNEGKDNVDFLPVTVHYTEAGGDSCSYTSGDWEVACSDECNISSNVVGDGSNITLSGTGNFNVEANITGFQEVHKDDSCFVIKSNDAQMELTN